MKWQEIPTPCYVVDEKKLKQNLKILQNLEKETGCHVLLAQKAFSMFSLYPLIGQYISGTTASGIFEARLGKEEMGKENHVFAPAYKEKDMEELVQIWLFLIPLRSMKSISTIFCSRSALQVPGSA